MSQLIDMNGELAQAEYQRRMSLAQALSQQAMSPMGGAAGNIVVPVSPLEGLGKLATALGARRQERKATEGLQQYAAQKQQRLAQTLAGLGSLTSPEEYQRAAIGMMGNPDTQPLAMELLKQSTSMQERAGERQDRKSMLDTEWQYRRQAAAEEAAAREQALQREMEWKEEQARLDREAKIAAARETKAASPYYTTIDTAALGQIPFDSRTGNYLVPGVGPVSVQDLPGVIASNPELTKLVKPSNDPNTRAAVAGAETTARVTAEAGAKRDYNMAGLGEIIDDAKAVLKGKDPATGKAAPLPTGSGAGALLDAAAGFFGQSPDGAEQADSLEALGGVLVSKMPRMEGPQSNLDVENYREMAGRVGNRSLPRERRLAALAEVERLWRKYDKGAQAGDGWSVRVKP